MSEKRTARSVRVTDAEYKLVMTYIRGLRDGQELVTQSNTQDATQDQGSATHCVTEGSVTQSNTQDITQGQESATHCVTSSVKKKKNPFVKNNKR